jgi:hypothetical protein
MNINKIDKYFKTLQKHLGCESFTYNVSEGFKVKLKPLSNKEDVLVVLQLRQRSEALPVEDRTELSYSYLYMNLVLSKAIIGLDQEGESLDLSGEYVDLGTFTEEGKPLKKLKEEVIQDIFDSLPSGITQAIYAFYLDCVSKYSALLDTSIKVQLKDPQLEIDTLKARIEELEHIIKHSAIENRQKTPLETVEESDSQPIPQPLPQSIETEDRLEVDTSTLSYSALNPEIETPPVENTKRNPRFK